LRPVRRESLPVAIVEGGPFICAVHRGATHWLIGVWRPRGGRTLL